MLIEAITESVLSGNVSKPEKLVYRHGAVGTLRENLCERWLSSKLVGALESECQ